MLPSVLYSILFDAIELIWNLFGYTSEEIHQALPPQFTFTSDFLTEIVIDKNKVSRALD